MRKKVVAFCLFSLLLAIGFGTTFAQSRDTLTVNSLDDVADGLCSAAHCSLREAINAANVNPGSDVIRFSVSGIIQPTTPLPTITSQINLNAITGNGDASCPTGNDAGNLHVRLDGNLLASGNGLTIGAGGDNSRVIGFSIGRFPDDGIHVEDNVSNLTLNCNLIGLTLGGATANGNGDDGIEIVGGSGHLIGGDTFGERNVISDNGGHGIVLGGSDSTISRNLIGLDTSGLQDFGNGAYGVVVKGNGNTIGGTTAAFRNVIAGGDARYTDAGRQDRINVTSADNTTIRNNYIGTDVNGENSFDHIPSAGVELRDAVNTVVRGNLISGNTGGGVSLQNAHMTTIEYNRIGSDPSGDPLPNLTDGVRVRGGSGSEASPTGNTIRFNEIANNEGIGINLLVDDSLSDGVTPNDAVDADSHANLGQNFPRLLTARESGELDGFFAVQAGTYTVDVYENDSCDPTGYGEGQRWLATFDVTSAVTQVLEFNETITPAPAAGKFVALTATDADGNTSEFSPCYAVTIPDVIVQKQIVEGIAIAEPTDVFTYRVTIFNDTGADETLQITDTLPSGVTLNGTVSTVVLTPSNPPANLTVDVVGSEIDAQADFPNGAAGELLIPVRVDYCATADDVKVTNTAYVSDLANVNLRTDSVSFTVNCPDVPLAVGVSSQAAQPNLWQSVFVAFTLLLGIGLTAVCRAFLRGVFHLS